jgi:hypothetical protein
MKEIKQKDDLNNSSKLDLVLKKMNEPVITVSDVFKRLNITRRQLIYFENILFDKRKKSRWGKYSICDLLAMGIYVKARKLFEDADSNDQVRNFLGLRRTISHSQDNLWRIIKGERTLLVVFEGDLLPHFYASLQDLQENSPFEDGLNCIFHYGNYIRKVLRTICVNDFSADVNKDGKVTFKIDGDKIEFDYETE